MVRKVHQLFQIDEEPSSQSRWTPPRTPSPDSQAARDDLRHTTRNERTWTPNDEIYTSRHFYDTLSLRDIQRFYDMMIPQPIQHTTLPKWVSMVTIEHSQTVLWA